MKARHPFSHLLGSVRAALFLLPFLTTATQASTDATSPPPNVLFLVIDDLRPELGAYGHPLIQSPNLDRLASEGTLFEQAYCQQAICSASRSSLLTGRRPDTTRVYGLKKHFREALPDVVTLPQYFKENGYHVEGLGKIYHSPKLNDPASWSVPWRQPAIGHLNWLDPKNVALLAAKRARGLTGRAVRGPPFEHADVPDDAYHDGQLAVMAEEALDRLAKDGQPFFLAVGFHRPHLPFNVPQRYWDLYDHDTLPLAPNPFLPEGATRFTGNTWGELRGYHGVPKTGPVDEELARNLVHGYYASVSYSDALAGRVLDRLRDLGLAENTIVVVWGDHGWKLGEHGMWCKHTNFEIDCRVPLIIRVPGHGAPGQRTAALVELVDLYPTLADLAGLPLSEGLEGRSLVPLLARPDRPWSDAAYSQYPGRGTIMGYAMKTADWRYIEWRNTATGAVEARELYDHRIDPGENHNRAADPAQADRLAQLADRLKAGFPSLR